MFMQRKLQKFFSFLDYIKRTIHFIFYCRFTLILYLSSTYKCNFLGADNKQ